MVTLWGSSTVISGNQSISNIKFDGKNETVHIGIEIDRRSDVTITGILVQNFWHGALEAYNGGFPAATFPNLPADSHFLSNLVIQNSTFKNSGEIPTGANWAYGSANIRNVRDSVIRHCTVDESVNGAFGIKACPKGLRHSHVIACISRNIPLTTVKKWLGHARLETTAIYADALGEEERQLAKRLWRS